MVKICINCNAENLEEALFCKKCGTKLPTSKEIENARREEQEEADRKWKEDIRRAKEKNEALNETRRNEGSVSVYGTSSGSSSLERGLSVNSHEFNSSSKKYYEPPHRIKKKRAEAEKKSEGKFSLIIINLSIVLLFLLGGLSYFYIEKEGISINNITDYPYNEKTNSKSIHKMKEIEDVFIDTDRKLMWQDNVDSKKLLLSWKDAKNYCDNLFLGNSIDWRIPMKYELQGILDTNNYPAIVKGFKNVSNTFYWSTPIKQDSSFAWHIFFGQGGGIDYEDMENLSSIRCVRNY